MRKWLVIGVGMLSVMAIIVALPAPASAQPGSTPPVCIGHRFLYLEDVFEPSYSSGCSGHDEPELDPVSNVPGSAQNITWTIVLPSDHLVPVSAVGPTFWFGGTVNDSHSLLGQAFVELQFYPDAVVTACTAGGGYFVKQSANLYSVCSPVWKISVGPNGTQREIAAFNAMLLNSTGPRAPLVMHAGDQVTIHWFVTSARDGFHVTVRDTTRGTSGTIVLNSSTDGPLMPAYNRQIVGNSLGWGVVHDTPNSFVWEIGHTSNFAAHAGRFCTPNQTYCKSYNGPSWAGTLPLVVQSVTFANGVTPSAWDVASDYGGEAEVNSYCSVYGGPYCIYPWFTLGPTGFQYGVDFPGTVHDFGKALQFAQTPLCGGPFGANSTYCDSQIVP